MGWMPERIRCKGPSQCFIVSSLVLDRVLTYSEYKLAGAMLADVREDVPVMKRALVELLTSVDVIEEPHQTSLLSD